jgi:hypothetical protein
LSCALFLRFSGSALFFRFVVSHEYAEKERRVVILIAVVEVVEVTVIVAIAEVVVLEDLRWSRTDAGGAEVAIQFFRRDRPERLEYNADLPRARLDWSRSRIPSRSSGGRRLGREDSSQIIGKSHQD